LFAGSKIPIRLDPSSPKKVVGGGNSTSESVAVKKLSGGSTSDSPDSTSKKVETSNEKKLLLSPKKVSNGPPKPWLSPKMFRSRLTGKEPRTTRSLSVDNTHQKAGLKPLAGGRKTGDEFLMEEDGEMSTGSTSDSEVVVVVNQMRKSQQQQQQQMSKDNKKSKTIVSRGKLGSSNDEEKVRFF